MNTAKPSRDSARYSVDGDPEKYNKGRLVLAIVNKFVEKHPNVTVEGLRHVFSDKWQGRYIVRSTSDAVWKNVKTRKHDFFCKKSELICLKNGDTVAVCNQWGIPNIFNFLSGARALGYEITEFTKSKVAKVILAFGAMLCFSVLQQANAASEVVDGITWYYVLNNGEASVGDNFGVLSSYSNERYTLAVPSGTTGALVVPSTLGGCPVTAIGYGAFGYSKDRSGTYDTVYYHLDGITSVALHDGITCIGGRAFAICSNLTHMYIPSSVLCIGDGAFSGCSKMTNVTMSSCITSIGSSAFSGCSGLTKIEISNGAATLGDGAFTGCSGLKDVTIPKCVSSLSTTFPDAYANITNVILSGTTCIGSTMFAGCESIVTLTIPATVTRIDDGAFQDCSSLTNITFLGDAPDFGENVFYGTPKSLKITATKDSVGWDYYKKHDLLTPWGDRTIVKPGYPSSGDDPVTALVTLATTNVVIHYLTTNVPVNVTAPISKDTAIVNVMTEIEGGNIAIPDTWAKNYPNFTKRFGSDFSAALTKYTGKYDGAGNPLFVWQDYVAGTDPTDIDDVFIATITMVEGKPQVQWDPVLVDSEAAKRIYTKYGKVQLQDEEWDVISDGEESKYNFFKVTVKMK